MLSDGLICIQCVYAGEAARGSLVRYIDFNYNEIQEKKKSQPDVDILLTTNKIASLEGSRYINKWQTIYMIVM